MASPFSKVLLFSFVIHFYIAICAEYDVNGADGWFAPKHDDQIYNKWASKNRFKVDDTIRFKYKKDSVLLVTEAEYEKCQTTHPHFFSNNGDTVFKLYRPGFFYFISGVTGHCQKGQKMIIKVLDEGPAAPPQSQNQNSTTDTPDIMKNAAAVNSSTLLLLLLIYISFWLAFSM